MIKLEQVSFAYQREEMQSVKNINLEIEKGQCVLLCGESGCGKTTITRLVNGLIPGFYEGTLTGRITIDGQEVQAQPLYALAEKVGSVFQNPRTQFFNVDTTAELAFGIENKGLDTQTIGKIVSQTIEALRLESLANRNIFHLSGGEKQQIAFASIYALTPDIFVLDEPSSNLDRYSIQRLKGFIQQMKEHGKTILIAEHRLYYLLDVVDRIVYIHKGEIQRELTPKQLCALDATERTRMGLRSVNLTAEVAENKDIQTRETVLAVSNLTVGYKKKHILKALNFTANRGDLVAIVGENGVGKTTFVRTLCGLNKHSDGEIHIHGEKAGYRARQKKLELVMQDVNYQIFGENLIDELCYGMKKPDVARAEKILKELGLYEKRQRHPQALSGGEKQRLLIGVCQMSHKEIWVLDEPTSGLDYTNMERVTQLIKGAAEGGKVVLIVTHDMELICKACNRIVVLKDGQIKEDERVVQGQEGRILSLLGECRQETPLLAVSASACRLQEPC